MKFYTDDILVSCASADHVLYCWNVNRLALVKSIPIQQDVTSLDIYKDEIITINSNNSVSFIPINDDVSFFWFCFVDLYLFFNSFKLTLPSLNHRLSNRKWVHLVLYQRINYYYLAAQKAKYSCMHKTLWNKRQISRIWWHFIWNELCYSDGCSTTEKSDLVPQWSCLSFSIVISNLTFALFISSLSALFYVVKIGKRV